MHPISIEIPEPGLLDQRWDAVPSSCWPKAMASVEAKAECDGEGLDIPASHTTAQKKVAPSVQGMYVENSRRRTGQERFDNLEPNLKSHESCYWDLTIWSTFVYMQWMHGQYYNKQAKALKAFLGFQSRK